MPEVLSQEFYGNTILQYLSAAGIIIASLIAGKLMYWMTSGFIKRLASKTESELDDLIVDLVEEPVVFALVVAGVRYALTTLHFADWMVIWIDRLFHMTIVLAVAWMLSRLFEALFQQYIVPLAEATETDLDDQLLPIVRKGVNVSIWVVAGIVALNNAGYDVGALIACMGIGGLALAMSSKDTVANMFGGVTSFTDKPFKLNDRVKVAGYDGFIREIGIRSTRLQTLEGRIVTIPNAKFAESPVENVSLEPSRKVTVDLGLVYETTAAQMRKAMDILQEIADGEIDVAPNPVITFNSFGDFAMNIRFIYFIEPEGDIFGTQTNVNLAILEEFGANGLDMAFPTQTVYHQAV
jgi:MscS family membrane protein